MIEGAFITALSAYLLGVFLPLFYYHNNRINIPLAYGFALVASATGIAAALLAILKSSTVKITLFPSVIFGHGSLFLDGFSNFFLLTISVVSFAVSIYAPPYMRKTAGERSAAGFGSLYNLFLLSLVLVTTIDNAFYFAIFWEAMTLASYFLVVFDHKKIQTVRAGFQYLVMTHVGTAFILVAFILLATNAGSFNFADFEVASPNMSPALKSIVFLVALIGFGTKAGLVPLHVWLPRAHPAAPSHISALMSGIMIKTAVYGLVRVIFDFISPVVWWWGLVIIILAGVSALLGIMYALVENDIKRLLAFSSVENIGIILVGVGLAVILGAFNLKSAALLSLAASLFHLINHAIFKGLLFLGAGSIHYATGTKNIEELGGLIKGMPVTAAFFLIGSLASSAMPPLNGFASEWMLFQSILQAHAVGDMTVRVITLLLAPALALTGGLAAACFVKAFGISFLSLPRGERARQAREVPLSMLIGMGVLGALSIALGVGATAFVRVPLRVAGQLLNLSNVPVAPNALSLSVMVDKVHYSIISLPLIMAFLVLIGVLAVVLVALRGKRDVVIGPTWDCGISEVTPRMEYSATAFSQPLRIVFKGIYQAKYRVEVEHGVSPYYPSAIECTSSLSPVFERYLYQRFIDALVRISVKIRKIQAGSINLYLAYIFAALVVLLVFMER